MVALLQMLVCAIAAMGGNTLEKREWVNEQVLSGLSLPHLLWGYRSSRAKSGKHTNPLLTTHPCNPTGNIPLT